MTLWLILLLIWLGGIPAAILVSAAIGSHWYERRLERSSRASRKSAVLLAFDERCGRRARPDGLRSWASTRRYRRAAGRRTF
jgi:hypothetical protein